jgi:MurNAc alpha-1-phosphate uridylyltransferase
MRPLTEHTPKPLLKVHNKALIEWTLEALQAQGYSNILINTAWLGSQIREALGNSFSAAHLHAQAPVHLQYSCEDLDFGGALETAGGIVRALPFLSDPFWVVAADAYCPSFEFAPAFMTSLKACAQLGHIWLVNNPPHHPKGDFCRASNGLASLPPDSPHHGMSPSLTFSTIGLYKHAFFQTYAPEIPVSNPVGLTLPLGPILKRAIKDQALLASQFEGQWVDVGTPERLALLNSI